MPTKSSKYKQSIYDIVAECFGNLDYLVQVSNDNGVSISEQLNTGSELVINNENLGDANIKEVIVNDGLVFNNNYVAILSFFTVDTTHITADDVTITADTR